MEVILLKDVDKVGLRGDVVNVARGFMRNYLQPRGLAEPATQARVAELGKIEARRARQEARSFEQAQEIAETLRTTVLRFEAPAGPRGTLFGSITATNVVEELWRVRKIRVDRRKVHLPEPIKRVGRYEIPIDVFQDVRVDVKTLVAPEGGELPSEDEIAAWEAEEAAEAGAPDGTAPDAGDALPADAEDGLEQIGSLDEPTAETDGPPAPDALPTALDAEPDDEGGTAAP